MITLPMLLQTVVATDPNGYVPKEPSFYPFLIATIVKVVVFFFLYMIVVAYSTLLERKLSAWIQDRHGPNRVGPWGLFQPLADGLKNIMKEETYPSFANIPLFLLAPALAFMTAMLTWCVIPFAAPWDSQWGRIPMVIAPLPIGFLFILAISSLGVYGIVMAGWSSNNKYALLGGLRSSAQMVSYEIAMGMSIIPVLLVAGNVTLDRIVQQQASSVWNVVTLTIAFVTFIIAALAETNRVPFDLPEAESELVAGYHSEYSAMKFSMFFIAEYANMTTASALMATLFLGGWSMPFLPHSGPIGFWMMLLTFVFFWVKVLFFIFIYMWLRWTLPRFRYDQLMALGWKFMLPTALAYIVIVAAAVIGFQLGGIHPGQWQFSVGMLVLNLILLAVLVGFIDRGRIISPAYSRLDRRNIEKLRRAATDRVRFTPAPESGD